MERKARENRPAATKSYTAECACCTVRERNGKFGSFKCRAGKCSTTSTDGTGGAPDHLTASSRRRTGDAGPRNDRLGHRSGRRTGTTSDGTTLRTSAANESARSDGRARSRAATSAHDGGRTGGAGLTTRELLLRGSRGRDGTTRSLLRRRRGGGDEGLVVVIAVIVLVVGVAAVEVVLLVWVVELLESVGVVVGVARRRFLPHLLRTGRLAT